MMERYAFFDQVRSELAPLFLEANVELENADILRFLLLAPNLLVLASNQEEELVASFSYTITDHSILEELNIQKNVGNKDYSRNEANITQLAQHVISESGKYDKIIIGALRRLQEKESLFHNLLVELIGEPKFNLRQYLLWQCWHFDNVFLGFLKRNEEEILKLISEFYVLTSEERLFFDQLIGALKEEINSKKLPSLLLELKPSSLLAFLIHFPSLYLATFSLAPSSLYFREQILLRALDFSLGEVVEEAQKISEECQTSLLLWQYFTPENKEDCFEVAHILISNHSLIESFIHKLSQNTSFSIAQLIYSKVISLRYDPQGNTYFGEDALHKVFYKLGKLRDDERKIAEDLLGQLKYHLQPLLSKAPFPLKNSEIISLVLASPLLVIFQTDKGIDYEESLVLKKFANIFLEGKPFMVFDTEFSYQKYSLAQTQAFAQFVLTLTQDISLYEKSLYTSLKLLQQYQDYFNRLPIFQLQGWEYFSINSYIVNLLEEFKELDLEYGYKEERKIQEILVNITYLPSAEITHIRNLLEHVRGHISNYIQQRNIELSPSTLLRILLFTPVFQFISIDSKVDYEEARIINDFVLSFSNDLFWEVFTLDENERVFSLTPKREEFLLNEFEYLATHWKEVESSFLTAYQYLLKHRSFLEGIIKRVLHKKDFSLLDITVDLLETVRLKKWEAAIDDAVIDSISLKIINRIITQNIGKILMEELRSVLATYLTNRQLKLKNAELLTLILMAPLLFVINFDQTIDTFERKILKEQSCNLEISLKIFHFLNEEYVYSHSSLNFNESIPLLQRELLYLAHHIHEYESIFVNSLKKIIENRKSIIHFVDPSALPPNYKMQSEETLVDNMLYIMHWVLYNNFGNNYIEENRINNILRKLAIIE
ncbi:MAG: hypothetical protein RML72_10605 [Bacteroidia bacterium]|nr:hypothetical protein [Bacteroidia bacterium]MDW8159309.1 hypothetical protein [Bacteroidia bacterium]